MATPAAQPSVALGFIPGQQTPVAPPPPPASVSVPQPQAPAPVAQVPTGMSRVAVAEMLGGALDILIVKLADAAQISLQNRFDVNQLAQLAEKEARQELNILDLAQGSYGAGKQAAQRRFGALLSKHRNVFLLLNGYDPILADGYLDIVFSRVTRAHLVHDQGRQTTTLNLE